MGCVTAGWPVVSRFSQYTGESIRPRQSGRGAVCYLSLAAPPLMPLLSFPSQEMDSVDARQSILESMAPKLAAETVIVMDERAAGSGAVAAGAPPPSLDLSDVPGGLLQARTTGEPCWVCGGRAAQAACTSFIWESSQCSAAAPGPQRPRVGGLPVATTRRVQVISFFFVSYMVGSGTQHVRTRIRARGSRVNAKTQDTGHIKSVCLRYGSGPAGLPPREWNGGGMITKA